MKKTFAFFVLSRLSLFAGCDKKEAPSPHTSQRRHYELALVTDVGNIDDQSFNQSAMRRLPVRQANGIAMLTTAPPKTPPSP